MTKYLALYMGSPTAATSPADMDQATIAKGMAAWGAWMETHAARIIDAGGPLGATKKTAPEGVSDFRNAVTGYVIVEAESHEAAARMFEDHPHFAIFPGDSVEIMPCLPIPGA